MIAYIFPSPLISETTDKELIPENIYQKVDYYAEKYHVSASVMHAVVKCESEYQIDVQSKHIRPDGTREKSFGLSQIYLPSHPDVSYEEAIDPDFALEFMAEKFSKGKQGLWSCYKDLFGV
ncbi:MAG: hypothetical protein WC055_14690 [Melioribacteraceae bacterium]